MVASRISTTDKEKDMKAITQHRHTGRGRIAALGFALSIGAILVATSAFSGASVAAPNVVPTNTGEPRITGIPSVGKVQRATRGSWTGTEPISYTYRWFRCDGRGLPDASDCRRISNAGDNTYVARQADAGFRLRVQVTGTNAEGSDTGTSNPTEVIQSARPTNTERPSISGTAAVGNRLIANRGTWVGDAPITYSFQWLRCNQQGGNCSEIAGATDNEYVVVEGDLGRTLRVRVTARNDVGSRSAISQQTGVVGRNTPPPPPPGSSIPVTDVPNTARLIVSEVRFTPNPVTSRTAPITARVRVKDTRGFVIRGALVFMRATPRVTSGARMETQADGWATFQLVPNRNFPQPRSGYNVQFFIKAYRAGDPPLAGIAGYRLVQVRLAG